MKATINSQFSLKQFNGSSSFTLWQRRVKDILVQQGLARVLKGKDAKPTTIPRGNYWSNSNSRGKGVQCYNCEEFGHVKRDCPLRKNKGKKFDDASSSSSLVVADDGDLLTVSEGVNTSSRDESILDSGCSIYACLLQERIF
ncbi:hypothetical protein RHMOL_Rhmol10G0223500 [Rhododendron molle]|uniref:Uncharacterized protein n=1 Tax=Rhododendron molle TaxID=49168 RepID=A0ACC0M4Q5_RHOML|nr:hypothetical protein RHMOL_Rhmol10G0223500 [Rhododendron molle]